MKASLRATSVLTAVFVLASGALPAQTPAPQPAPLPAAIAAPKDIAYRGTLRLSVDATDLDRRIFRVRETIPTAPGSLTLLYPRWLPGYHSPGGRIELLAGLVVQANGKRIPWTRDAVGGERKSTRLNSSH